MVQINRPSKKGGGLAIYIRQSINYKQRPDLECNIENEFESLFLEAKTKHKLIIGEIYRVTNTNESESILRYENILNKLTTENKDIIIGTDQNFDYIKLNNTETLTIF